MINLLFDKLRPIAQQRNISNHESKSEEDLIRALTKPKSKLGIKNNKLEEIKKKFYNSRYTFSKKEVDKYRKVLYDIKNYRHLSESEIDEIRKNFSELEKNLVSKKSSDDDDDIDSIYYDDLDNFDDDDYYFYANDDKYRKIGSVRTLFKKFDRDYFKPIITAVGFDGGVNNYIKYNSKGDKYENLSSKEYLNMIRSYLRDLINNIYQ